MSPYVSLCSRRIRRFLVVVVQWTSKTCTKKHENQLLLLFFSRCVLLRGCLNSPMARWTSYSWILLRHLNVLFMILTTTEFAHTLLSCSLTGDSQRAVVSASASSWWPVLSGLPQCLGLFFFCGDLPTNITSRIKLFADNCVLYRPINSIDDHLALKLAFDQLETTSVFLRNFK